MPNLVVSLLTPPPHPPADLGLKVVVVNRPTHFGKAGCKIPVADRRSEGVICAAAFYCRRQLGHELRAEAIKVRGDADTNRQEAVFGLLLNDAEECDSCEDPHNVPVKVNRLKTRLENIARAKTPHSRRRSSPVYSRQLPGEGIYNEILECLKAQQRSGGYAR